jgi:hypothetical protein
MTRVAVGFAVSLIAALAGVGLVGANLGGAFAIVTSVALLVPVLASGVEDTRGALLASVAGGLGAALASFALLIGQAFTASQVFSVALTVLIFACAIAVLVRMFMLAKIPSVIASATVTTLALAWLSWPVWISPWLTSESLARKLSSANPLLAINAIAPQFGFWTQSKLMYRLTTLGQDVGLGAMPDGILACVIVHAVIALAAAIPVLAARRTSAPSASR